VTKETRPLTETHPDLALEADGWDPSTVTRGNNNKFWWKCQEGHRFESTVGNRALRGGGCPYCANKKVWVGYNDLATRFPELAAEIIGVEPSQVLAGGAKTFDWKCPKGHTYPATIRYRIDGHGCSVCTNHRVVAGVNDLATLFPALASEAVGWDPTTVGAGTPTVYEWHCPKGHTYKAAVRNRSQKDTGCTVCSNQQLVVGINDMATTHPELAAEALNFDPKSIVAGTAKRLEWKCREGHTWLATGNARTSSCSGCPYCARQRVLPGVNDLATTNPTLAAQAVGWDPSLVMPGSGGKYRWRCDLGHEWVAYLNHRARGVGCPYCANQKVWPGFNDLQTIEPGLAAQAHGWDPSQVLAGSSKKLEWVCSLGHTWVATVDSRRGIQASGCPYCSNNRVLAGFNDMATTHPELAEEADGWDPRTVIAGQRARLLWKCSQGHPSFKMPSFKRVSGQGCPACAKFGFNPGKPGWLYLFEHELWGLLQIGITNVPDQRLAKHQASGWRLLDLRGPMPGEVAREWEQSILRSIRRRGVNTGPKHIAGKFDGYSEAWLQDDLPVHFLKSLTDLVHADEQN
jgi:Probable Zinc-ribbon domain